MLRSKDIVLFLSRIHRKKGLEVLVPAMKSIVRSCPNSVLVIAGAVTSEERTLVRSLLQKYDVTDTALDIGFL